MGVRTQSLIVEQVAFIEVIDVEMDNFVSLEAPNFEVEPLEMAERICVGSHVQKKLLVVHFHHQIQICTFEVWVEKQAGVR